MICNHLVGEQGVAGALLDRGADQPGPSDCSIRRTLGEQLLGVDRSSGDSSGDASGDAAGHGRRRRGAACSGGRRGAAGYRRARSSRRAEPALGIVRRGLGGGPHHRAQDRLAQRTQLHPRGGSAVGAAPATALAQPAQLARDPPHPFDARREPPRAAPRKLVGDRRRGGDPASRKPAPARRRSAVLDAALPTASRIAPSSAPSPDRRADHPGHRIVGRAAHPALAARTRP